MALDSVTTRDYIRHMPKYSPPPKFDFSAALAAYWADRVAYETAAAEARSTAFLAAVERERRERSRACQHARDLVMFGDGI